MTSELPRWKPSQLVNGRKRDHARLGVTSTPNPKPARKHPVYDPHGLARSFIKDNATPHGKESTDFILDSLKLLNEARKNADIEYFSEWKFVGGSEGGTADRSGSNAVNFSLLRLQLHQVEQLRTVLRLIPTAKDTPTTIKEEPLGVTLKRYESSRKLFKNTEVRGLHLMN